jgi:hypothetical protein
MTSSAPEGGAVSEFFRMSPPLLRRLPAVAMRRRPARKSESTTEAPSKGKLSPKMSVLVLLSLFAQAGRCPKGELKFSPACASVMASVTCPIRMAEVLEDLGYRRRGGDFSGSAWSAVSAAVERLTKSDVRVAFHRRGPKGLEQAYFLGALLEAQEEGCYRLFGYSPPRDKYFVLVSRKLLSLRAQLTELGTRIVCWLYAQHRGRRVAGKLRHKWDLTISPEVLVDAKVLKGKHHRRAADLRRMRDGFKNLESLGILSIDGDGWPFRISLSREFFHQEVKNA